MNRIDAAAHTRGESLFLDDMPLPSGMLYASVFSSPVMHGNIIRLQLQEARLAKGVVAVLSSKDIPGINQIGSIIQDEELLAQNKVNYIGQPVAVVVAESQRAARNAAKIILAEIEELPAVTDPKEAFEKGYIIDAPRTFTLGDVDSLWQKCDLVVEGSCDTGGQEHVYLETQRARAVPLEGNNIRIYSSTQSPSAVQHHAAKVLGLSSHNVEVEVKRIGGGFGGKEDQATPWACMAALAAWITQRPVELVLQRGEDMRMTGKRHPYKSDFKMGVTKEGVILGYEVKHYQNSGAVADLSTAVLERTMLHSTNCYYMPNVRIFGVCCKTNLPPNTAFRGFGAPQGMFAIESAITKVAEKLNMPREEIQAKNLLAANNAFPYGQTAGNCSIRTVWEKVETKYTLQKIRKRALSFNKSHFETKKGVAVMPICFGISFTTTYMNQASALVHVFTDGSVSVSTGGVEMGQGLTTNITAIAAKALGINHNRIKVEATNTTRIANMSPSAASATTLLNGNALLLAVNQIIGRLKSLLAQELSISDKEKISIANEKIFCNAHDTGWTWEQLIHAAHQKRINLSAHGFFATPKIWFDKMKEKGSPFAYHVYGAAVIEVTLDCLRGVYTIDSVKIVHDLGRPINETVDRAQIEGGLAQGLGWMALEDLRFNDKGQLLSRDLATYKVPDAYFMPDDIEIEFLENEESLPGPYGSKAVGEPPFMYGIGVFFALRDAMRAFMPENDFDFATPLTPERVLLQLCPEYVNYLKCII
ncbi:molybdopterin cofactor-binding domain-containing protein [Candidatus Kuenenia sp.]|uniref:xanthine dehydrogenase molybdopterin binding subunit n=1 Tax=Candidatus Kuenenia sp. TaxID=2499824 RepID=UPI00321F9CC8